MFPAQRQLSINSTWISVRLLLVSNLSSSSDLVPARTSLKAKTKGPPIPEGGYYDSLPEELTWHLLQLSRLTFSVVTTPRGNSHLQMFSFDASLMDSWAHSCFLSTFLLEHKGFQLLAASQKATSVDVKNPWARPPALHLCLFIS